ncbi:MAG: capsule assembly Wzi family protein [Rubrivivax sp.]
MSVFNQQDPYRRLADIDAGRIASTWSSLPASSGCSIDEQRVSLHAGALAEPSRAAQDARTGSFDLIDPRYRAQLDVTAQTHCVFAQISAQRRVGVDGDFWSMDGSALSWQINPHWRIGAGLIARQWGPAWDGSLILGTTARPVGSVSIDADTGVLPQTSWWSWLGQVQFTGFLGQLEDGRGDYSRPWLLGMRVVVRPIPALELGASRTAQVGGEGRDNSIQMFWKALLGSDNQTNGAGGFEQPGNQLGGFDARFSLDRWLPSVAVYGQMIGEDEAANLPSKYMVLGGASWRHANGLAFVEWTDSTAGLPGVAYNHFIYTDGYRYHGRPLGYWADGDSNIWTFGALWQAGPWGGEGLAVVRSGKLNDAGASTSWPQADLLYASAQWRVLLQPSLQLTVAADVLRLNNLPASADSTDTQLRVQLQWW